jgi:hypothetical protein
MHPERLSDLQLYRLLRSTQLRGPLKGVAAAEYRRRQFSGAGSSLLPAYEPAPDPGSLPGLSPAAKGLILLVPFPVPVHAILANRHIARGNIRRWRQHWRCVTLGFALWTAAVLLLSRYWLF